MDGIKIKVIGEDVFNFVIEDDEKDIMVCAGSYEDAKKLFLETLERSLDKELQRLLIEFINKSGYKK